MIGRFLAGFALLVLLVKSAPLTVGAAPSPQDGSRLFRITVSSAGLQDLSPSALSAAGLDLTAIDASQLRLQRGTSDWALEVRPAGLRFYAPPPGDRWNRTDTYWLSLAGSGPRITTRQVGAPVSGASSTARQLGVSGAPSIYESRLAGLDGDSWYVGELCTLADRACETRPPTLTLPISATLPLVPNGTSTLTVSAASVNGRARRLQVTLGTTSQIATWTTAGTFSQSFTLNAASAQVDLTLLPTNRPDQVVIDTVAWDMPVQLSFAGQGASFASLPGQTSYQLQGLPDNADIYDITTPETPVRLTGVTNGFTERDGQERRYIVAGPGTTATPSIAAATRTDLRVPLNANAVYIGPSAFAAALAPLIQHRTTQGYAARYINVEDIYDGWSGGQVSPEAIRGFLRYARDTWSRKPVAAILVGDGTSDPHNYTGRNNTNWVPPYLVAVDPWLGETACENCYGQLDGDGPTDDPTIDLQVGRLPVKNETEAASLVAKLITYDAGPATALWRGRLAFIADNADDAGDFPAMAGRLASLAPANVERRQITYNPDAPTGDPRRDPILARQHTINAFEEGAAVISYVGHGLMWQFGYTGPPLQAGQPTDKQHFLGLYDPDSLNNGTRLPIVLSMTCLTGAFQTPAFSGTTIDERLVLAPEGGAIAVWGSSGQGLSNAQELMQQGFFTALWDHPESPKSIGTLVHAGYDQLNQAGTSGEEARWTFLLLGDPLTPLKVNTSLTRVNLPLVHR
jgi:hypothetical protein